jgi:hypothetical protein
MYFIRLLEWMGVSRALPSLDDLDDDGSFCCTMNYLQTKISEYLLYPMLLFESLFFFFIEEFPTTSTVRNSGSAVAPL